MSATQGCPLNRAPLYSQTTDVKPPLYMKTMPTQIHDEPAQCPNHYLYTDMDLG